VQVGVGDVALLALLAAPVERDAVAVAVLDVPVDAVVGDVELAADEPLRERRVGPVEDLVPLLEPVQRLGLLGPPALVVLVGLVVDRRVVPQRVALELLRWVELLYLEQLLELALQIGAGCGCVSPDGSSLSSLRFILKDAAEAARGASPPPPPHDDA
jgi:hypothetical protein